MIFYINKESISSDYLLVKWLKFFVFCCKVSCKQKKNLSVFYFLKFWKDLWVKNYIGFIGGWGVY